MRDLVTAVLLIVGVGVGCATSPPHAEPVAVRAVGSLNPVEEAVVRALMAEEAAAFLGDRPVLLLDITDNWLPQDMSRPSELTAEQWLRLVPPIPEGLRLANAERYLVGAFPLPDRFTRFSTANYAAARGSEVTFKALVKQLGGKEPLVLSVSRPFIDPSSGDATIVLHVDSTWSGCGGANQFKVVQETSGWVATLQRVLVLW